MDVNVQQDARTPERYCHPYEKHHSADCILSPSENYGGKSDYDGTTWYKAVITVEEGSIINYCVKANTAEGEKWDNNNGENYSCSRYGLNNIKANGANRSVGNYERSK